MAGVENWRFGVMSGTDLKVGIGGTATGRFEVTHITSGSFQAFDNGYMKNSWNANNYLEHNPAGGVPLTAYTTTASITGFRATNSSTILTMVAGSAGASYIDVSTYLDFYANTIGVHAGRMDNSGNWGFGTGAAAIGSKVHVKGISSTSSDYSFKAVNSSDANTLIVRNDDKVGIGSIDWTSGVGGTTEKLVVRGANGDTGYHTLGFFENSLNPTVNNVYYNRTLTASAIKYGTFNTYQVLGSLNAVNNQGTGTITEMFGIHSYALTAAAATIGTMAGFYADKQIQAGTITVAASLIADTTQISGGATTNLYGLYVKTPTNVSGGTITNTAGVYIESNTVGGTANWGVYQSGINNSNYFNGSVRLGSAADFGSKLSIETPAGLTYGMYINPFNLASGGSGIYITGQATGAGNYHGLRSYAPGGSTGDNMAIWGWSEGTAAANNYGGYFVSRNGATGSYGIYAAAAGGDSINSTNSAGVVGQNESVASTTKRGGWFYSTNNVNSGTAFGVDAYSSTAGTSAINYGVRGRGLGAGATVTNYGGYFSADGGTSALNYGLFVTASGGATNWGVYQDGSAVSNYFNGLVRIGAVAGAGKLFVQGTGTTSSTVNIRLEASDTTRLFEMYDDGHIGMNSAPTAGDRLKITAGSGLDGAINISCANTADNGYALLAQGGTASANYNGLWSDASGGTGTVVAVRGSALGSSTNNNYGGYFLARNGTSQSFGVFAQVSGGDSVASTDSSGVYATNGSTLSTSRKGLWAIVTGNVNSGSSYGVKAEVDGGGTTAINYGLHARINGAGSGRLNYGVYLQVDGGTSATNYGIVTTGGEFNGLGTTTPTALLELVGGQFFVTQDADTVGTGTVTIDFAQGNNKVIDMEPSTGAVTVTLSNPKSGAHYTIKVLQGSGGNNLVWPAAVLWPGGTAPTITVTDNAIDLIRLYYDGTNYLGTFNQAFA